MPEEQLTFRKFRVEPQKELRIPVLPESTGMVGLLEPELTDAATRQRLLGNAKGFDPRGGLLVHALSAMAAASAEVGFVPRFAGTLYVLDAFQAFVTRKELLRVLKALAIPGDRDTPGPPIIRGFPPRPGKDIRPSDLGFAEPTRFDVRLGRRIVNLSGTLQRLTR